MTNIVGQSVRVDRDHRGQRRFQRRVMSWSRAVEDNIITQYIIRTHTHGKCI